MLEPRPTYEDLQARLAQAEAIVEVLQTQQVDAIVGKRQIALIRLRETEAALLESEARYRTLVEGSLQGMCILNRQGTCLFANRALAKMLGYEHAEALFGQHMMVFVAPHERSRLQTYREAHLRGESAPARYEYQGVRSDGTLIWCEALVSCVPWEGESALQVTLLDITERKRLEQEILEVSNREQQRLGQNLHDGLGQSLAGIAFLSKALEQKLAAKSLPEAATVAQLVDLTNQVIRQTRDLAREFYPVALETHGLVSALQLLAANTETLHGISCCVTGALPELDSALTIHLYRIAQEALYNAIKHGHAQHVVIGLSAEADHLRLTVRDDGVGFPDTAPPSQGLGLRIMHHRAHMIGGTLAVQRAPGGGTLVACVLPVPEVSP